MTQDKVPDQNYRPSRHDVRCSCGEAPQVVVGIVTRSREVVRRGACRDHGANLLDHVRAAIEAGEFFDITNCGASR